MTTNRDTYAEGLLFRALDPRNQPEAIRRFLREEVSLLTELIPRDSRVVDFGCGAGRHLIGMADRIRLGVGLDYEPSYVAEARRTADDPALHFVVADGTRAPLQAVFDRAVCLTSTWGTMSDKMAVLREMRRVSPEPRTRMVTAYSTGSVGPRREWYERLGLPVTEETDEHLVAGGFVSEHFTEERLRGLLGDCELHPLGDVAFLART